MFICMCCSCAIISRVPTLLDIKISCVVMVDWGLWETFRILILYLENEKIHIFMIEITCQSHSSWLMMICKKFDLGIPSWVFFSFCWRTEVFSPQSGNCTFMEKFSVFLSPLHFLEIGSWIQRLYQTEVQSLWEVYRWWCVLSSNGTGCLVLLFLEASSSPMFNV